MADDVSDVIWPRGIFEAKGGHHQKEHKKLWSYFSMTVNYNEWVECSIPVRGQTGPSSENVYYNP